MTPEARRRKIRKYAQKLLLVIEKCLFNQNMKRCDCIKNCASALEILAKDISQEGKPTV